MAHKAGRRLYLNGDRSKVVPEDHPDAHYLLAAEGDEVSDEDAARYGLTKAEQKAEHKAEDKAMHTPDQDKAEGEPSSEQHGDLTMHHVGRRK